MRQLPICMERIGVGLRKWGFLNSCACGVRRFRCVDPEMRIFYARSSTADQKSSLAGQIERAEALGIEDDHIFAELVSGAYTGNGPRLKECLRFLRKGDVLICTKPDRLARSMTDLADILKTLEVKGANFKVLDQREIDATTPNGRRLFGILASVAEFERALIKDRRLDGIRRYQERLAAEGRKPGRIPKVDPARANALKEAGKTTRDIKAATHLSRASVFRALAA
jgi:DNA invertase Pin-like site-specific DNA recombinase